MAEECGLIEANIKNNKMFVDLKEANRPSDAMFEIWLELFSC